MKHLKKHILTALLLIPSILVAQTLKEYLNEFETQCKNARGYSASLRMEVEREGAVIPDVAQKYTEKVSEHLKLLKQTFSQIKKSLTKEQLQLVQGHVNYLDEYCKRAELHCKNLRDELEKSNPKVERVREYSTAIYNELRKASGEMRLLREKLGVK